MIPEKQYHLHSLEEIDKILRDNIELSEQVKRLVKTEYALYNTQSELDNQISLYKELYETGKKISITLNVHEIFSQMGDFIINHLNFGGYLLLQRIKNSFYIKYHDGCCSNIIETKSTRECQQMRKIFKAIQRPEGDYIVSETTDNPELLNVIRSNFGFDEFVVHAFLIGAEKTPSYLLIVGNPTGKDFFTPILPNTISIIGLGNLVSLVENALNNIIHYQQLLEERKLLEIKVTERTQDLKKAMKDLKN